MWQQSTLEPQHTFPYVPDQIRFDCSKSDWLSAWVAACAHAVVSVDVARSRCHIRDAVRSVLRVAAAAAAATGPAAASLSSIYRT